MVLNNKSQMFTIWFPEDFFYPQVSDRWLPVIRKMNLPFAFQTVEDYMNFCIQSASFAGYTSSPAKQRLGQYEIEKRGGKELEAEMSKDVTLTIRLTESYASWWIAWEEMWWFMHYGKVARYQLYLDDISMGFLSDRGLLLVNYRMNQITPTSIGNLEMSYRSQAAQYNSFTWTLHYNHFDLVMPDMSTLPRP